MTDQSPYTVPESYPDRGSQRLRDMVPLRGRALLEVERETGRSILYFPEAEGRADGHRVHFGRVLALGAPALSKGGVEVPWGCAVGDRVLYVYAVALEHNRRDGELVVVGQEEVQAVVSADEASGEARDEGAVPCPAGVYP